jgi:hypothetical protein
MTVVVDIDDLYAEVKPVLDWLKTQGGHINFIEGHPQVRWRYPAR